MQILLALVSAFLLVFLAFKLISLLLRFVFSMFLGMVKLAFVVACMLSVVYFAIHFSPLF